MKPLRSILLFCCAISPLVAAEWPREVEHYEALILQRPGSGAALRRVRDYATKTGRIKELQERWEARASGTEELRYRLMLGALLAGEGEREVARAQFQKATEIAPGSTSAWKALGELDAQGKLPEARAALEKAVELGIAAADPDVPVESLALDHLAHGRREQAFEVLRRGWTSVRDPDKRVGIAVQWARSAAEHADLAGMIAELEQAQRAGDRVAAAALARVYQAARDPSLAAQVLADARQAWPDDGFLRRHAIELARVEQRTSELARLLREEAQKTPTPEGRRTLFEVLLANGAHEEARRVIDQHGAEIAVAPATWRDSIQQLWELDLAKPLALVLEGHPAESRWETALVLAELRIVEGDEARAAEALWSIFDRDAEAQPLSSLAKEAGNGDSPSGNTAAFGGIDLAGRRFTLTNLLRQTESAYARAEWHNLRRPAVHTLQDARDLALLYLAMLTEGTEAEAAFLQQLSARLKESPRSERIFAWSVVENVEGLLAEIEAYAAEGARDPELDQFCAAELEPIRGLSSIKAAHLDRAGRLLELFKSSSARASAPRRKTVGGARSKMYGMFPEITKAFEEGDFAGAVRMVEALGDEVTADPTRSPGRASISSTLSALTRQVSDMRGQPAKVAEASAALLRCAYPRARAPRRLDEPPELGAFRQREPSGGLSSLGFYGWDGQIGVQVPDKLRERLVFPPVRLFGRLHTGILWSVFSSTRDEAWPLLKEKVARQQQELSPERAFFAKVAGVYLAWWHGEEDEAIATMRRLLEETGDDDVRMGLASMLTRQQKTAEAIGLLGAIKLPYPAFQRRVQAWQLTMAVEAKDTAIARGLVTHLPQAPLTDSQRRSLAEALEKAGLTTEAARFREGGRAQALAIEDSRGFAAALRELSDGGERAGALALARKILAASPQLTARWPAAQGLREAALQTLQKLGERDAHAAAMEKASAAAPGSADALLRLAEALTDKGQSAAACRKVLELEPGNRVAARRLAAVGGDEGAGGLEAFDPLLAISPGEALTSGSRALSAYTKAKQLPRLAERIVQAPWKQSRRGRPNGTNGYPWKNLADNLIRGGQAEVAVGVLRTGITVIDMEGSEEIDLRRMLFQQLVKLGRVEEARRELIELLAPLDQAQPAVFAFRSVRAGKPAKTLADPQLFETARELGALPEIRERVQRAAGQGISVGEEVRLFLQVSAREPAVLPAVHAYADRVTASYSSAPWLLMLAEELAAWPEARGACLKVLEGYNRALANQSPQQDALRRLKVGEVAARAGGREMALQSVRDALEAVRRGSSAYQTGTVLRQAGELAAAAQEPALLGECARLMVKSISESKSQPDTYLGAAAFDLLVLVADAGQVEEERQLLSVLRKSASREDTSLGLRLKTHQLDTEFKRGELQTASPLLWLDADRSTPDQAALVWDIGAMLRSGSALAQPITRGEPLPQFDGRFDLELLFGEEAESMRVLGQIPRAQARGAWKGALPGRSGYVRATLREGERCFFSEAIPVCAGPNLLTVSSPDAPAWDLPRDVAKRTPGGPVPEGDYVSFRPDSRAGADADRVIAARRVKMRPGRDYVISGWVRGVARRDVRLGWRALDGAGATISEGRLTSALSSDRFWIYGSRRVTWKADNQSTRERLPLNTVFLEPVIHGGGNGFDLAALSVVEVPEVPNASTDP